MHLGRPTPVRARSPCPITRLNLPIAASTRARVVYPDAFCHAVRPSCRENFILELGRHGMGKRDIVPNLNFSMNVPISADGELAVVDGISAPGGSVDLLAGMDVLCVVSDCPQLNNPCNGFNPSPIRALIWNA